MPAQVQGSGEIQLQRQPQVQVQPQIQTQVQRLTQPTPQVPTTPSPRPSEPFIPPFRISAVPGAFPLPTPRGVVPKKKKKRVLVPAGYVPEVRRRGVFRPITQYAYPKEEALAIGIKKVLGTAAATVRLTPSRLPVRTTGLKPTASELAMFRPPKRATALPTYVQKAETRITSRGEKIEIALRGVMLRKTRANVTLFGMRLPKSRPTKFKNMRFV